MNARFVVVSLFVAALLFSNFSIAQSSCIETLEKDQEYIISTGIVAPPLEASQSVTLKDGVWLQQGSEFVAKISDCQTQAGINTDDTDDGLALSSQSPSGNNIFDTKGELTVEGGVANYTLPIALPPSIKNFGPSMALTYKSGYLHGVAGLGWSISGVSSIQRVSSRVDLDGVRSGVRFDDGDKLTWNGQRLILKTGKYWEEGSTYETEIHSNTKIELHKDNETFSFVVTMADGMRYWYGKNYWEGIDAIDQTTYFLVRQEDIFGNYVLYNYLKNQNSLYIHNIQFSANEGDSKPPLNEIVFHYETTKFPQSGFVNGQKVIKALLLSRIDVKTNDNLFRRYVLSHQHNLLMGFDKLFAIQEFNGAGEAANPVTFEYNDGLYYKYFEHPEKHYENNINFDEIINSGDFDGDGRNDFIIQNVFGKYMFTKVFEGTTEAAPKLVDIPVDHVVSTIDGKTGKLNTFQSIAVFEQVDGLNSKFNIYNLVGDKMELNYSKPFALDLRPNDIDLQLPHSAVTIPYLTCSEKLGSNHSRAKEKDFLAGDFNGDGITEIIITVDDTQQLDAEIALRECYDGEPKHYYPSGGYDYCCGMEIKTEIQKKHYILDLNPNANNQLNQSYGYLEIEGNPTFLTNPVIRRIFGDFNGDGKTDVFTISRDQSFSIYEIVKTKTKAYFKVIGKGVLPFYEESKPLLLGDFNGDGKTDLTLPVAVNQSMWGIHLSNPKKDDLGIFESSYVHITPYVPRYSSDRSVQSNQYFIMDPDKNGKSDLVRIWKNAFRPSCTIGSIETQWDVQVFFNRLDINNSFDIMYSANPGLEYGRGCEMKEKRGQNWSKSSEVPMFIFTPFKQGDVNSDLIMIRNKEKELHYFEFDRDFTKRSLLKKVTSSNGMTETTISYNALQPSDGTSELGTFNDLVYSSSDEAVYPNVEIKSLPNSTIVTRLTNTTLGVTKYQDYRYHGLTYNMEGLGLLGYKKSAKSEWYLDENDPKKWFVSETDPLLRGAVIRNYVIHTTSPFQFYAIDHSIDAIPDVVASTHNTYELNNNDKVYSLLLTTQVSKDHLTKVKVIKTNTYDTNYNLPVQSTKQTMHNNNVMGETVSTFQYDHNESGVGNDYYIGRLLKKESTKKAYGDTQKSSVAYVYSDKLLVETKKWANNNDGAFQSQKFAYDLYGNVVKETIQAVRGNGTVAPIETSYTYDRTGRFIKTTTNSLGQTTTNETFHPIYGLVTLSKGSNSNLVHRTIYDYWGNPIEEINYLGRRKIYKYSRIDGLITTEIENEDGSKAAETTTILGQLMKSSQNDMNGVISSVVYEYDFKGRRTKSSEPFTGGAPSFWNEVFYDKDGRVERQEYAAGKTVNYEYDDETFKVKATTVTPEGTQFKTTIKNAIGHTLSTSDPGGTITYSYNANGQLLTSTYGARTQTIEYDDWGRKTKLTDPSAGVYTYQYDAYDNVLKETTPKGSTEYLYDQYGRVITKTHKNQSGKPILTTTSVYDQQKHYLTRMDVTSEGETMTYTYVYDTYDRLKFKGEQSPHATFNQAYTYDGFGRLYKEGNTAVNKVNNSAQSVWIHHLYKNGFHWKIEDDSTNELLWRNDEYNQRGQLKQGSYGNDLNVFYDYDSYGYLKEIVHGSTLDAETQSNETHINTFTYTFDRVTNNMTSRIVTGVQNASETFQYDLSDRLTRIKYTGGAEVAFNYDHQGRFTQTDELGDFEYSNSAKPYQLTKIRLNSEGRAYQSNISNQNVTYNSFKRPVRIEQENQELIYFSYNAFEQRSAMYYGDLGVNKQSKKLRKHYSHDGSKEFVYDSSTGKTSFVTYIGGDAYSAPLLLKGDGSTKEYLYLHRDHQGSITAITDQNGALKESRLFDAWGGLTSVKDGQGNELAQLIVLDRGYTGHEHLQQLGIINMNGRLYDAKVHRFLSPDNFVQDPTNTQNYNRYGYVLNNPLKYSDPSGELYLWDDVIVAGVGFAVNYMTYGATTGDWGSDAVKQGAIGAGVALLSYYTGGGGALAAGGSLASAGSFVLNYAIATSINMFIPSFSIPISDNIILEAKAGVSMAGGDLGAGFHARLHYRNSDFNMSLGFGAGTGSTGSYTAWGVTAKVNDWGGGYNKTYYKGEESQMVGGINLFLGKDVSFRIENDFLVGGDYDRWRSNAFELSIGDFVLGSNLKNNDPEGEKQETIDAPNRVGKYNKHGKGAWKNGKVYSSPLWGGYRHNNTIYRVGYSDSMIQDRTQNWVHRNGFFWLPFGYENFYLDDSKFERGIYTYTGYDNPYSLW